MTQGVIRTCVVAAAGLMLLTACGGKSDSNDTKDIKGAKSSSPKESSPTASADAKRPKITFPSNAKNIYEGDQTGDAKKDAVLADGEAGINSVDAAIFERKASTAALAFYNVGAAYKSSTDFIKVYLDKGHTWVGTTRYFRLKVSFLGGGSAMFSYCSDESKSYLKNVKTGKVDHSSSSSSPYVLYGSRLVKNGQGVWQTTEINSSRGSAKCKR